MHKWNEITDENSLKEFMEKNKKECRFSMIAVSKRCII